MSDVFKIIAGVVCLLMLVTTPKYKQDGTPLLSPPADDHQLFENELKKSIERGEWVINNGPSLTGSTRATSELYPDIEIYVDGQHGTVFIEDHSFDLKNRDIIKAINSKKVVADETTRQTVLIAATKILAR